MRWAAFQGSQVKLGNFQVEIESLFSLIKMFLCSSVSTQLCSELRRCLLLMVRNGKSIPGAGGEEPGCFWRSRARGSAGLWGPPPPRPQPGCQQARHAAREHQQGSSVSSIASKHWEDRLVTLNLNPGAPANRLRPAAVAPGAAGLSRGLVARCHRLPIPGRAPPLGRHPPPARPGTWRGGR